MDRISKIPKSYLIFLIATAVYAIGMGFVDNTLSNYFSEVYHVNAAQRGFIEFPRELPGMLCLILIAAVSFLGDLKLMIISQVLTTVGILMLGLFTPTFAFMLVYLFINSVGLHLALPLSDSIALSLIEEEKKGKRMGQINGVRTGFAMVAGIIGFFFFKYGIFRLDTTVRWVFISAAILFAITCILFVMLHKIVHNDIVKPRKNRLLLKKKFKKYYMLSVVYGTHKQIIFVFGPWVLIELLSFGADYLSLFAVIGAAVGMVCLPIIGKWVDKFGIRKVLIWEAVSNIAIYVVYGILAGGFADNTIAKIGLPVIIVCAVFVVQKMALQMSMVRTMYVMRIADSPEEVTPTLSAGVSLDHLTSIIIALAGGWAWNMFGPQYVFYFAVLMTIGNLIIAWTLKKDMIEPRTGDDDVLLDIE